MDQTSLDHLSWYRATTLAERIASLQAIQGTTRKVAANADHGERRLQHWRSQPPFASGSYFSHRLMMDGIGEEELLYLLSEPIEAVCDRFSNSPAWLADLVQSLSRAPSVESRFSQSLPAREIPGLLNVLEPLVTNGLDRLHDGVQALIQTQTDLPFDPSRIEDLLCPHLFQALLAVISRTMALELNVARLQRVLVGESPEARFRSFCERLREPDIALAVLQEYPVLSREVTIYINRWVAVNLEFLRRFCEDWNAIRTRFSTGRDPGMLLQLERPGQCRSGRSVQIARFSSGFRIVYKPRSLALDMHFQELLAWANERGDHPSFSTLNVLDRGEYGWVEFVAAESCSSPDEIRRFYERQGTYLALLYALEATDFHCGNVIAKGEHPILIDLEALFHPRIGRDDPEQVDQPGRDGFEQSLLRVGLLPQRVGSTPEGEGIDLSGLGAVPGQLTPSPVPRWERFGTDEMCVIHKRAVMRGGHNRPCLNGADVEVSQYAEAIASGFKKMYHLLLRNRSELLASDGPVLCFVEDEVRAVLRSTQSYQLLLRDSHHPDILRDALDRDRLFDWLWKIRFDKCITPCKGAIEPLPYLKKVIPAEREDLWKGDIPIFTTRPGSRDLWTSSNERISHFFDEPSMNRVTRRIQQLSEDDLSHQLSLIRASLVRPGMEPDQVRSPTRAATQPEPEMVGASTN